MPTPSCQRLNCSNPGRWMPILFFWFDLKHPPARAACSLRICDEHKASSTVEDFLTDDGWEQIVNGFKKQGLKTPDRSLTKLDWKGPFDAEK